LFIPVKPDFPLPRFPYLTVLVCALCLAVFLHQISTWNDYEKAFTSFCSEPKGRLTEMLMSRIAEVDTDSACFDVLLNIDTSQNPTETIQKMADGSKQLVGLSPEDSRLFVLDKLTEQYRLYQIRVPTYPDNEFAYYTGSWNPIAMVTSSFTHGSWTHIIFNLIFWFAFAATIEGLIGAPMFVVVVLTIALFTGVFSSVSAMATGIDFRTVGLSGIVTGMLGLYAFLLPHGRIRCYYFFIVIFGSVAVPVWALALWYIGGDIFRLFAVEDNGVVNVMAHVSGGIGGYLFGAAFLRKAKIAARDRQL